MIDKELLDILACPACKADVGLKEDKIEALLKQPNIRSKKNISFDP